MCAVAGYFLIYALSLRLPCSMNKIKKKKKKCAHSSTMCVNCDGPHEAHSTTCTKRPIRKRPGEEDGEDDEVEMVGTT